MRIRQDSRKSFGTAPARRVPQAETPRTILRLLIIALACTLAPLAAAKLPPPTEEARQAGVEAAAKSAWNDKVGLFQLCKAIDRTAATYRTSARAAGKDVPAAVATAECADPGAYVSPLTPAISKPLEASGAHSPPGLAISPPSTKASAAEIAKGTKK